MSNFARLVLSSLREGLHRTLSQIKIIKKIHISFGWRRDEHIKKHMKKKHHKAGRPRSRPLLVYLFHYKLAPFMHFYKRLFPSPLRIAIFVIILAIGFALYSFFLVTIAHDLPSPDRLDDLNSPLTTTFYDRNGTVLYRLYDEQNRSLVQLSDLPQYLVDATIATEDKNFYKHQGFDIMAIVRSIYDYFRYHEVTGGSTITQQLIKNTLLTPDRTWQRKVKELILSFWAEHIFTKDQILQMYFNEAPYGGTTWGIAAASQTYFHKAPKDLDLAEASYLAGLPESPTTYSPYGGDPELGKQRQHTVLERMVDEKYIAQKQADTAFAEKLDIQPDITEIKAPHFVMYVKQMLDDKYGERMVDQGGLQVYTSLDLPTQEMAENVVADEVGKLGPLHVTNGAAMVTDPKTGEILAMVGSKDYWDPNGGSYNVTTALRQPGSSIKPITYATAFAQGYSPGTLILDNPTTFPDGTKGYTPVNYDGKFHGLVTLRAALGNSFNIPAVKVLSLVGINNMIQTADKLGITTFTDPSTYGLSLTLGGADVKMTDMMTVYGTFSQMGVKHDLQPILKVVDSRGEVLEQADTQGNQVLDPGVSYLIANILSDNQSRAIEFGLNSALHIPGHTVAVKTGTTDEKRDNWTFGYTPNYVVGSWVGNNDNSPMNQALASGITGAAPIWNRIMSNLLANKPDLAFTKPADVVDGMVDGHNDLVLKGVSNKTIVQIKKSPESSSSTTQAITFQDPFSHYSQNTN